MEQFYIDHLKQSFDNGEQCISKINQDILSLDGMTGVYTRHFYNNLLNFDDARYLEIGTWKGSSVCSAMYGNKAKVVCIEHFGEGEQRGVREAFYENFNKFKGENDATFIEQDSFTVDVSKLPFKFNIYMYDGNHEYDSHYRALSYYYDCLDDTFIYIVDDWNTKCIRDGTHDALKQLKFKILYEKEVRLTYNNQHTPPEIAHKTWWNGVYMAVLQKSV